MIIDLIVPRSHNEIKKDKIRSGRPMCVENLRLTQNLVNATKRGNSRSQVSLVGFATKKKEQETRRENKKGADFETISDVFPVTAVYVCVTIIPRIVQRSPGSREFGSKFKDHDFSSTRGERTFGGERHSVLLPLLVAVGQVQEPVR